MQNARPALLPASILAISQNAAGSVALSCGCKSLSYAELDLRSGKFAGYLVGLGVAPGETVAICLERSIDWVIAALGILRAGCAYVPLDPGWPENRLAYAVKDSGATVVIASKGLAERIGGDYRSFDPVSDAAALSVAEYLEPAELSPDSLAYVIYTSGSTGVPKGVEITHANLSHLIGWHQDAFGVSPQDRCSHLAGLGFDASVWEIWPALCSGATLCIIEDALRSSPEMIHDWLLRERVTIGFVPTVHASALMGMNWPADAALRVLLTGGDALNECPPDGLPFQVVNNYGPTECTVVATSGLVTPTETAPPSIGWPIAGATVYLLDDKGASVGDGEIGEIYIGGNGVGRGYRNLADSTRSSFLPDPFSNLTGARMYRSGDLGVRGPEGQIYFRGRVDRQVKIRGYRIELDEIAATLSQHPKLDFATVIVDKSSDGESHLLAYVLPDQHQSEPTVEELQEHLSNSLPSYMIPAIFVRLTGVPLSSSGKVDLSQLSLPTESTTLMRKTAKPPASPTEDKLLKIVRELLNNDKVTSDDNFFLAGGHSLLGMQLILRIRSEFAADLSLRQLFEAPTSGELAYLIEMKLLQEKLISIWKDILGVDTVQLDSDFFQLGGEEITLGGLQQRVVSDFGRQIPRLELMQNPTIRQQSELIHGRVKEASTLPPGVVALQPEGARTNIFWLHYACPHLAKAMGSEHPFFYVSLTDEDLASLGEAPTLEGIASCLVPKITSTQPEGPYILGGYCLGGVLAYELAYQLRKAGHEISLVLMLDTPSPKYCRPAPVLTVMRHPVYLARKVAQLGVKMSFVKLLERLSSRFSERGEGTITPLQWETIQTLAENANEQYRPPSYDGKVTLIIASDRPSGYPPEGSFGSYWQALAPRDFRTEYIDGHHLGLIEAPAVFDVAKAISAHLSDTEQELQSSARKLGLVASLQS